MEKIFTQYKKKTSPEYSGEEESEILFECSFKFEIV